MKRTALATLGIALGLATLTQPALAQSTLRAPADFGPPPSGVMEEPGIATPATTEAQVAPSPAIASEPAPAAIEPAPAAIERSPAIEPAPIARDEGAEAYASTRRAAPDREPPRDRRNPNPQTGHYLGHGLFNNWGPNDFGA